jgi:hypothetical protein
MVAENNYESPQTLCVLFHAINNKITKVLKRLLLSKSLSPFFPDSNRLELNEEIKLFRNVREREK